MFLHSGNLKKRMKRAASNGALRAGSVSGGTYVSDGFFCLWIRDGFVPNKIKGLLAEFTGETEWEEDTGVAVKKNVIQRETPVSKAFDLSRFYYEREETIELKQTFLRYKGEILFQEKESGTVIQADEELYALLDGREIEHDSGELLPECCLLEPKRNLLLWKNNAGCLIFPARLLDSEDSAGKELLGALREMDLEERRGL